MEISEIEVRKQIIFTNSYKNFLNPQQFYSLKEDVKSLTKDEIYSLSHEFGWNLEKYGKFVWSKKLINLKDVGPWPGMKGMNLEYTRGSVTNSADMLKNIDFSLFPKKLIKNLGGISNSLDFTKENFIPVFLTNHLIRKRDSLAERLDYDIWDGNTRCLAYALNEIFEIEAYVGKLI